MRRPQALLVFLILLTFCRPGETQTKGRLYVFAIDISASRSTGAKEADQAFLRKTIEALRFNDEVAVIQVLQAGIDQQAKRWFFNVPGAADGTYVTSRDDEKLHGYLRGIEGLIPSFFKDNYGGRVLRTDLLTTMLVVEQFVRDANGREITLVVLSDMLQSSGAIEMDKARRMPSDHYLEQLNRTGALPKLRDACVLVVGADDTNPAGAKVRNFWEDYFRRAGAHLKRENYRIFPPNQGLGSCK